MIYERKYWGVCMISLVLFAQLSGCALKRSSGWEKEVVTVKGKAAELIEQADQHWALRQDILELEKALELFEQAAQIDPKNLELFVTMARGYYFLADAYLVDDPERQAEIYDKSLAYAEKGMALHPQFKELVENDEKIEDAIRVLDKSYVGAMYWASASLGKWALNQGLATTLANKERGRKMIEHCLELDDTYFHGGPHRWLGAYYATLPAIAGRDLEKIQSAL